MSNRRRHPGGAIRQRDRFMTSTELALRDCHAELEGLYQDAATPWGWLLIGVIIGMVVRSAMQREWHRSL